MRQSSPNSTADGPRPTGAAAAAGRLALRALPLALVFLLLVGKHDAPFVVAGLLAGLFGAAGAARAAGRGLSPRMRAPAGWARYVLKLPGKAVKDTGVVFAALLRRLRRPGDPAAAGTFVRYPFEFAAPGEPEESAAARRALVTAGVSFAPNTCAVRLDPADGSLLVHQLAPVPGAPGGGDTRWPG